MPVLPFIRPIFVLVGWSLIGSGLLAWRSRADSCLGPVLIFTGFAWFASTLSDAHDPVVFTIGEAIYPLYIPGILYLILCSPVSRAALDRGGNEWFWELGSAKLRHVAHRTVSLPETGF